MIQGFWPKQLKDRGVIYVLMERCGLQLCTCDAEMPSGLLVILGCRQTSGVNGTQIHSLSGRQEACLGLWETEPCACRH